MTRRERDEPKRTRPGLTTSDNNNHNNVRQMDLRIGSVNVGTMVTRGLEVARVLGKRRVDICCVQETQFRGSGGTIYGEGKECYKFVWMGEKDMRGGVGIMIREELIEDIVEVQRISPRIMSIKLIIGGNLINVISAYAPQGGRSKEEKEEFWEHMDDSMIKISNDEILLIGGDLNGHVGKDRSGWEEVMGIYGYGERNADGENILEICQSRQLKIMNTMFKKEDKKKITYKNGGRETQVDYILVRVNRKIVLKDCKVIPGEECFTQHRLLCGDIKIIGKKITRKKGGEKKIKQWKLKDESIRNEFEKSLENKIIGNEGKWENLRNIVMETGREICGETSGSFRIKRETWWWNEEVQQVIREKKEAYKKWQKSGEEMDKEAYMQKKKEVKIIVAKTKTHEYKKWEKNAGKSNMLTDLFKIAKQMKRDRQDVKGGKYVKDKKGKIKVDKKDIMDRWKEYFNELLNEHNDYKLNETAKTKGPLNKISEKEIESAMNGVRKGKAAGPTGLTSELLKATGKVGIRELRKIFNKLLEGEAIPKDWKDSITIPIYKGKGDAMDCGKYRGVRLLEHGMKLYEYVLEKRLRNIVNIGSYQCGFVQGRSTTDAIFIVRQLQEKYNQKKKKLYHIFIDLEKAFDRVPRKLIEWALRKKMVPEKMVEAIMALYDETRTKVKSVAGKSEGFDIRIGVHQGSILSPLLFIIVMDEVTKEVRNGVPWELGFADDLVLTADSEHEVLERFDRWREEMELRGLKVNMEKTKLMVTGKSNVQKIKSGRWACGCCKKGVGRNSILCTDCKNWCHKRCSGLKGKKLTGIQNFKCPECRKDKIKEENINKIINLGGRLKEVYEFCYLGDVLDCEAGVERAVRARVSAAWKKWKEVASLLINRRIPPKIRGSIYVSYIRSVLLYGSETWAMTQKDEDIMKKCDRRMLRYMMGVKWQDGVSSEDILEKCGLKDIQVKIRQRRLQWFGHVKRQSEEGELSRIEKMKVLANRPAGRPKMTWRKVVEKDMKTLGIKEEMAMDREKWRMVIVGPTPAKGKRDRKRI